MSTINTSLIQSIREFNRFYTNILGLLSQHMHDSEFSLAEIRVLYEIGHTDACTAKKIIEELKIDRGYLSKIIKRFEKNNLIIREQSLEDGRVFYLNLTGKGKDVFSKMDDLSNNHIHQMMDSLHELEQRSVVESMKTIQSTLSKKKSVFENERVKIRCDLRPGDAGYLIHLHGWIYAQECGFNHEFEGYVCKTIYNFFENYRPKKDRLWFAESDGRIIGSIAIVEHSTALAQLRWFLIHPDFRGISLGKTLMNEAMKYSKEKGYNKVFLTTTQDQKTAVRMYKNAGFKMVEEQESKLWGKNLMEQTYELELV